MATNREVGKGRKGMVANRSQFSHLATKLWHKRNTKSGKILDIKTTGGKFKGVRREK